MSPRSWPGKCPIRRSASPVNAQQLRRLAAADTALQAGLVLSIARRSTLARDAALVVLSEACAAAGRGLLREYAGAVAGEPERDRRDRQSSQCKSQTTARHAGPPGLRDRAKRPISLEMLSVLSVAGLR